MPTFEEAARKVHSLHEPTWKNPKHAAQFISTHATGGVDLVLDQQKRPVPATKFKVDATLLHKSLEGFIVRIQRGSWRS